MACSLYIFNFFFLHKNHRTLFTTILVRPCDHNVPGKIGEASLLDTPAGNQPNRRPRTRWSDYVSDLTWSGLGVEQAERSEVAENSSKVLRVLLGINPRGKWI